jgi:hypothetical protein
MTNGWVEHIKKYARENNLSYACALTKPECSQSYIKKTKIRKTKNTKPQEEPIIIEESPRQIIKKKEDIIGRFMLKNRERIRSEYLKAICSDSGVCFAFGKENKKIKEFFDYFNSFKFVQSPVKQIGIVSANGFIKEIKYKKNEYESYAILKSQIESNSDNLSYEYNVGLFVNKLNKRFSCFLETYGLFYYKDISSWNFFKSNKILDANLLKKNLILQDSIDFKKMCNPDDTKLTALLIQHVKTPHSLSSMCDEIEFITDDLLFSLYQVYLPLSILKSDFTHYDFHSENVLVYEPVIGKYIEYHYHLENGTEVNFKSPYILKIIDYGRSYYKPTDNLLSPTEIHNELCITCPPTNKCGQKTGLDWINPTQLFGLDKDTYYINSAKNNQSHDIRLLGFIKPQITSKIKYLVDFVKKIKKYKRESNFELIPEKKTSGLPRFINNVSDCEIELRYIISKPELKNLNNNKYSNPNKKLGDLHIYTYENKQMKFDPSP